MRTRLLARLYRRASGPEKEGVYVQYINTPKHAETAITPMGCTLPPIKSRKAASEMTTALNSTKTDCPRTTTAVRIKPMTAGRIPLMILLTVTEELNRLKTRAISKIRIKEGAITPRVAASDPM